MENEISDRYNQALEKYGIYDRSSFLWIKDKQNMRFNLLLNCNKNLANMKILNYNCEFLDLKTFLIQNFYRLEYNGCDINRKHVFNHIKNLFNKTIYMLTMNFLSHLTNIEYKKNDHFYFNLIELYDFAINNLIKRIIIDNSSLPFEITTRLFKNEKIDKNLVIYENI